LAADRAIRRLQQQAAATPPPTMRETRSFDKEQVDAFMLAANLMETTWAKKSHFEFRRIVKVDVVNYNSGPLRWRRDTYRTYKASLPNDDVNRQRGVRHAQGETAVSRLRGKLSSFVGTRADALEGNELLVFHGSAHIDSIVQNGFEKKYWKKATGNWQRFGPGFYFAPDASKAHEYPLNSMQALPPGEHVKTMLMCKVALGRVHKTQVDMPDLQGRPPAGCHSVHGEGGPQSRLNYDEIVVYEEAATLPYAVVKYAYLKK
jgi:hypothetical protein